VAMTKIAVTVERETLREIDGLVRAGRYANRSRAVQEALREQVARVQRSRLVHELSKIDPAEEKAMAGESFRAESRSWRKP